MPQGTPYGWKNERPDESHLYLVPATLNILRKHGVSTLLDIGTGNGAALPHWMAQGIRTSAMEPDAEGFGLASRQAGADTRQLAVGEALPAEWQNAFEAVVCLEVVEHLYAPEQLVQTVTQVLKPGGIAVVSTPYHGYLKNLAMALSGKWDFHHHPLRTGGHIKFWSEATLTALFNRHGYSKIAFKGVGRVPLIWKSMILVFSV